MKHISALCLAVSLSTAVYSFAQEESNQSSDVAATNQPKKGLSLSRLSGGGTLTDSQIAALKTEWKDKDGKTKVQFTASLGMAPMKPEEKQKYATSGKIPIRLTADLLEIKEVNGKNLFKRLNGSIHMYVKDADGKVVLKKSIPVEKMCPS